MQFDTHRTHHGRTHFRVLEDDEPTPSSSVEFHVEFIRRIKYRLKVRSDVGTRQYVIRQNEDPPLVKAIWVNPFLFWNNTSHVVSDVLSSLQIPPSLVDMITDKVISKGREIGNRKGLKVVPLGVEIVTFTEFTCTESAYIDYIMGESLAEGETAGYDGMVPASSSSIQALESVRMEEGGDGDGDGESCTICLEELPVRAQVTRLPCSHLFHSHCIVRWLEKSHYCPICRFEMPT